jgi:predicted homoserine dehydrogenase-like protein
MVMYDELCALDRSIRVGLVGAGFMGRGIVEVLEHAPGMEVVAVSDVDIERAESCYEAIGFSRYRSIESAGEGNRLSFPEERAVTVDHRVIAALEGIDMVVEATGIPAVGAEVALRSIMHRKHVGMLNVETDVTCGYYLSRLADTTGVVYTVCSGDEPAAVRELCVFARTMGFTVVACGKGKNNPLDRSADPDSLAASAASKGLNPRILTEFVDGTKTMVEMSAVANSCGLTIDRRNMHGPETSVGELASIFCLEKEGGILTREGVVDYAIGDVAPGVFCVVRHPGRVANETLRYLKIGEGPCHLLYRPYHLTNLEVPVSVGAAFLYGKPVLRTTDTPTTEVIVLAKADLKTGEAVDGIGGFSILGGIETYKGARDKDLLPLGLAPGAALKRDVEQGTPLSYSDVELPDTLLLHLRKLQDWLCRK